MERSEWLRVNMQKEEFLGISDLMEVGDVFFIFFLKNGPKAFFFGTAYMEIKY